MSDKRLNILSAGAPKTAIGDCADAFGAIRNIKIGLEFATAPKLKERVGTGTAGADIVVAPTAAMEGFHAGHLVDADTRVLIGSVRAAVTTHAETPAPDISSADALIETLKQAPAVIFNRASSGAYIETMIGRLGLTAEISDKVHRTDTGSGVMEYLADAAPPGAIGFGQQTEIQVQVNNGVAVRLVGPLPAELENLTTYFAARLAAASDAGLADEFLTFLNGGAAGEIIISSGISR